MAETDEILRVLNDKGKWTGKYENRLVVHTQGLKHNEVCLRMINSKEGTLLLQHRTANRHHANKIGTLSGHIEMDEKIKKTLIREAMEEMGLDLRRYKFKFLIKTKVENGTNNAFLHNFVLDFAKQPIDITRLHVQPYEVDSLFWMPYEEFKQKVREGSPTVVCKPGPEIEKVFMRLDKFMARGINRGVHK